MASLLAFSDEVRQQNATLEASGWLQITTLPRLRQCYGWMRFTDEELYSRLRKKLSMPQHMEVERVKRFIELDASYTAVIYEFIEGDENDPDVLESTLDFLSHAGFSYGSTPKANNWKRRVLIDAADIVQPNGYGLRPPSRYGRVTAKQILRNV